MKGARTNFSSLWIKWKFLSEICLKYVYVASKDHSDTESSSTANKLLLFITKNYNCIISKLEYTRCQSPSYQFGINTSDSISSRVTKEFALPSISNNKRIQWTIKPQYCKYANFKLHSKCSSFCRLFPNKSNLFISTYRLNSK